MNITLPEEERGEATSVSTPENASSPCDSLSEREIALYMTISWWFEGLMQGLVGTVGFLANSLAVPVLCSREMNSIFNRLLVFLSLWDNLYIVCSVLEGIRKHRPFSQTHELAFGSFLYQLHNFVLCCSIYTTLALALERYRAVWRPVEYHNKCKGANPWARVARYIVPVCIFSAIFNIPKLLEVEFVMKSHVVNETDPETDAVIRSVMINRSLASPTDLRLDDTYVIFYVNAARLLVQGVVPFLLLTVLNYRIYWVIRRRRQMINRPAAAPSSSSAAVAVAAASNARISSAQRKANETQQAVVLFFIVLLFFICHTPRFVLNVHEFLTLESLRKSIDYDCNDISLWALVCASVSHFLMTLNSSVNFFIYCFMCATFRRLLSRLIFRRCLGRIIQCFCRGGGGNGDGVTRCWVPAMVTRLTAPSPSPDTDLNMEEKGRIDASRPCTPLPSPCQHRRFPSNRMDGEEEKNEAEVSEASETWQPLVVGNRRTLSPPSAQPEVAEELEPPLAKQIGVGQKGFTEDIQVGRFGEVSSDQTKDGKGGPGGKSEDGMSEGGGGGDETLVSPFSPARAKAPSGMRKDDKEETWTVARLNHECCGVAIVRFAGEDEVRLATGDAEEGEAGGDGGSTDGDRSRLEEGGMKKRRRRKKKGLRARFAAPFSSFSSSHQKSAMNECYSPREREADRVRRRRRKEKKKQKLQGDDDSAESSSPSPSSRSSLPLQQSLKELCVQAQASSYSSSCPSAGIMSAGKRGTKQQDLQRRVDEGGLEVGGSKGESGKRGVQQLLETSL